MSHYCNDEDRLASVNYPTYQSVFVSSNVEDDQASYQIRTRVNASQFRKILPPRFLDSRKPTLQRGLGIAVK